MILSNGKVIASGNRLFDCRDYSIFTLKFDVVNTVAITLQARTSGVIKLLWGDCCEDLKEYNTPYATVTYTHTYQPGIYKFVVNTNVSINQIYANRNIDSLGGNYYKLDLDYISFGSLQYMLSKTQDAVPDYSKVYRDVTVYGNLKIDITRLKLGAITTRLSIPVITTSMNVVGTRLNFIEQTGIKDLILGDYTYKGNHSLHEIFQYCPNLEFLDIAYYNGAEREDISDLIPPATLKKIRLYVNYRYTGDITHVANLLNSQLTYFSNSENTRTRIDGLTGDYYAKTITDIVVHGDVTPCSFKFGGNNFQAIFKAATGSLNNIINLPVTSYLTITCGTESQATLDVNIIGRMSLIHVRISIADNSKFYGDISNLYQQNRCTEFAIAGLNGNAITGWKELVDNIYNARSTFKTTIKTFRCPNNMKNALTGTYQAPAGFIKGGADGNPTSSRECIYVLVNNYNWTFTNI